MKKILYDFLPVLLFFLVFRYYDIYAATLTGMIATGLQVALQYGLKGSVDRQQILTFVIFLVFGSMTLYFHNPVFVKWKPTVLFWIMALIFSGSTLFGKKPLLQRMMEESLDGKTLEQKIWSKLTHAWALFFATLGGVNLYIAYSYSTSVWVSFKFYGITGLMLLFCLGQAVFLSCYMTHHKD